MTTEITNYHVHCSSACTFAKIHWPSWRPLNLPSDFRHFGVWVDDSTMSIGTYCEGDVTVETARTIEDYYVAVVKCIDFYRHR